MFRLHGKHFFLTYPRTDVGAEALGTHLVSLFTDTDMGGIVVVKETHGSLDGIGAENADATVDGELCGYHMHCVLRLTRKWSSSNPRVFDYEGHHPNIQRCRSLTAAMKYVGKEMVDYWETGSFDRGDDLWPHFENLNSELEVMEVCGKLGCIHHCNYYVRRWKLFKLTLTEDAPIRGLEEFVVPVMVSEWIENHHNKALVLLGPSGYGKTSMARAVASSLGTFLWAPERQSLAAYSGEVTVVFDDLDLHSAARTTVLNFVDTEQSRAFRVLYGSVSVGAGVRRIFTSNRLEDLFGDKAFLPEVDRRILIVHCGDVRGGEHELRRCEELPVFVRAFT